MGIRQRKGRNISDLVDFLQAQSDINEMSSSYSSLGLIQCSSQTRFSHRISAEYNMIQQCFSTFSLKQNHLQQF